MVTDDTNRAGGENDVQPGRAPLYRPAKCSAGRPRSPQQLPTVLAANGRDQACCTRIPCRRLSDVNEIASAMHFEMSTLARENGRVLSGRAQGLWVRDMSVMVRYLREMCADVTHFGLNPAGSERVPARNSGGTSVRDCTMLLAMGRCGSETSVRTVDAQETVLTVGGPDQRIARSTSARCRIARIALDGVTGCTIGATRGVWAGSGRVVIWARRRWILERRLMDVHEMASRVDFAKSAEPRGDLCHRCGPAQGACERDMSRRERETHAIWAKLAHYGRKQEGTVGIPAHSAAQPSRNDCIVL